MNCGYYGANEPLPEQHFFEGSDGVREEVSHFIHCVQGDQQPISTGTDGKKALEIALATIDSICKHTVITFE